MPSCINASLPIDDGQKVTLGANSTSASVEALVEPGDGVRRGAVPEVGPDHRQQPEDEEARDHVDAEQVVDDAREPPHEVEQAEVLEVGRAAPVEPGLGELSTVLVVPERVGDPAVGVDHGVVPEVRTRSPSPRRPAPASDPPTPRRGGPGRSGVRRQRRGAGRPTGTSTRPRLLLPSCDPIAVMVSSATPAMPKARPLRAAVVGALPAGAPGSGAVDPSSGASGGPEPSSSSWLCPLPPG